MHDTLALWSAAAADHGLSLATDVAPRTGPAWTSASELVADDTALDELVAAFRRGWGTDRDDIAGAFWLSEQAFALLLRAAVALLAARRVPVLDLGVASTRLRSGPGARVDRVALGPAFACLPDDPAAGHPAATVVADEHALLERLLRDAERHHTPIVALVHRRCRRPERALWRHCGDAIAESFLWAGEIVGRREEAWRWGSRAVRTAPPALRTHAGYRTFGTGPWERVGRVRAQCCLHYRTSARSYCLSCPLQDDAYRDARLAAAAAEAA